MLVEKIGVLQSLTVNNAEFMYVSFKCNESRLVGWLVDYVNGGC